jgi:hypothetical protein
VLLSAELRVNGVPARSRTGQQAFGTPGVDPQPGTLWAVMGSNHRCQLATLLQSAALPLCQRPKPISGEDDGSRTR